MLVWLKLCFIFIAVILISFIFIADKFISILITGEFLLLFFFFFFCNIYLIFDIMWVVPFAFCIILILSFELALSILLLIFVFKNLQTIANTGYI